MIIHNCEQRSDSWFDAKCGRVTGTRFKPLMSGLTTKGFNDLVADVMAEIITGNVEPTYSNDIMQRGLDLEPEARKEYENINSAQVDKAGFITPDENNEFAEWVGISPDGIIDSNFAFDQWQSMLEIKCPLAKTHLGYIAAGKLPSDYVHQVQGQLFVTGLDYCDFMSYYPGMKPFIIRVEPDKELFEKFSERLRIFIDQVKAGLEKYHAWTS